MKWKSWSIHSSIDRLFVWIFWWNQQRQGLGLGLLIVDYSWYNRTYARNTIDQDVKLISQAWLYKTVV